MKDKKLENYIYDLGVLLKERAREAKREKDVLSDSIDPNYKLGYLMALHDIVSLMKQQADVFEIDQESIGLKDIEPESELL